MRIKLQDTIKVIAGKDKGKTGKVTQILPEDRMVVVEGINKMFKNIRPQKKGDKGQRVEFAAPLYVDKVMIVCSKCNKPSRMQIVREGKKVFRRCKKCKEKID